MAKKKIVLTNAQMQKNEAILTRIQDEKDRLVEETRMLQEQWSSQKRRRRRRKSLD